MKLATTMASPVNPTSDSRVAVIVATYGDREKWDVIAQRAVDSVRRQTVAPEIVRYHGVDIREARNTGASMAGADNPVEWLIFLDADDELDDRYVEEMVAIAATGEYDLIQPATLGFHDWDGHVDETANVIETHDFFQRNNLVIGTMARKSLFEEVGGFDDWYVLEDWALFIKLVVAGARVGVAEKAIYRVHFMENFRENSRNFSNDPARAARTYGEIRRWGNKLLRSQASAT